MTKGEVKKLEAEEIRLLDHARKLRRDYDEEIDRRTAAYREKVVAEMSAAADEIVRANIAHSEAVTKLGEAKIALTMDSKDGFPIGTILYEWKRRSYGYHTSAPERTGRTGIVDVWTKDSEAPAGMRWTLPRVGDKYVRVLRKDGARSTLFDTLGHSWRSEWQPKDWTPPKPKKSERRF